MLFIFQKETLLVIHQGAVILANSNIVIAVIVIMLNKYDNSDSRGDASSPNDCMEESQCVGKKDYSETTYTEEQNSQNERD